MLRALAASSRRLMRTPDSCSKSSSARAFLSCAAFGQRAPTAAASWHSLLPTPSDPRRTEEDARAGAPLSKGARAFSACTAAGAVGIDTTGTGAASAATADAAESTTAATDAVASCATTTTTTSVPGLEALLAPLEAPDGTLLDPLGWYPQDVLLEAMAYAHDALGLTWGVTVVASALLARFAVLPLQIWVAQKMSRMAVAKPELDQIVARQKLTPGLDPAVSAKEIRDLYTRHKVNPIATVMTPFLQMPLFMAFFFGTKKVRVFCCCCRRCRCLWSRA
jgi:hypothetical protein